VLEGNSSETITIRYDAATTGTSGGNVEIASSDFLDSPYVFPIRGSLETSEIDVVFDGQSLVDGNATVDFGSTTIGTPVTVTLTINNPSGVALLLGNLQLPEGYSLVGEFPDSVPANSSTDVTLQLDAAAAGTFTGTVSFDSNDEDESTFSFTATGTVTEQPEPEVRVSGPLGTIESGGSYDFGVSALGESPAATFTVTNGGTADLTLDRASLTSSLAGTAFSVSSNFAETTLEPSASTTFEISLDASSAGTFSTTLSFTNNDSDENPFGIALSGEVSAPEIEVRQDARVLQDGSSVPVDFGATTLNAPVTVTFTVNNLGSVPLSLGGLDVPVGFALDGDFPTSVDGNGSATFSLVLEATSLGSFDGQVSFENNDSDENPFTFRVQGVVDAAELTVLDGLLTVPNGSTVDFGSTVQGNAVNKIFTIRNDGGATLQVDNLDTLPAGFALLSPEPFTFELAPNQQATFTLSLTAETVGDFSGALQFISNDTTASPFSITLEGRVTAEPAPEISVSSESGAVASGSGFSFDDVSVGEDATETFTIRNTGTAPLSLGSVTVSGDSFVLAGDIGTTSLEAGASTTFDIRFEADEEGEALGSVSIDNGDENENPYVFDLDGTAFVPSPEVAVRASDNSVIADGSSLDIGTVVTGADASVTFTVTNEGQATLTLGDLAISGDGFAISNGFGSTTLEPDASTTFAVRFSAGEDEGEASGEVTFTNNDSDENPYNITLTADVEVPQPEIAVVRGGALIADGGTFDFGDVAVGQARNIDFTVQNNGTATLNLEPLEITGEGFSLETPFASTTLEPEASTTFTLRFNSADLAPGEYSGNISFANNDSDENPYNVALAANVFVPTPEIAVTDPNGQALEDGGSVSLQGVGVGQPSSATFTVFNEGDANLTLNAASLASSLAGTPFSVRDSFAQSTLAPGEDTQFTLGVNTSSAGTFSADVAFNNNDRDENPFNISLSITISAGPEVDVRDGNISIPDGSVTAVNIGETTVGTPITRTFSVINAGGATLTLGNFQIDNSAFTLVGTPPASLAPGQSGSLVIQLNAVSAGTPVAQVSFTNSDSDESPYTFTVRGTVTTSGNGERVVIRAGNNPPPTTITANPGDSNVAVLQALLSLEGDIAARMTRFDVTVFELLGGVRTPVTSAQNFAGFASAKLYQDSNNNGQVDVSDALLATTTTFDGNNLVFNLNTPLPLSNTSVTNVLVTYDFLADFGTNRLPVVALASLLPLVLLALKRWRRVSLLMLLVIFMAACGGDDGGGDGGVTPPPPAGVQYQAFLVDAAAESNGQTLPVDFTAGDIPGSIVGLQD
jgi:P pilus assembly chaperone PapD